MHDEDADGCGDASELRRAIDLGVVHIQAGGHAAGGDGLAQTVQKRIQSLVGIKLSVGDEPAGVIERGLQKDLPLTPARPLDPGAEQHIGLPVLIGVLGFVLFVRRGFVEQQLTFGEAAGAQEAIERGDRQAGLVLLAAERQLAQQGGTGAVRVLAFEPFDQCGDFRRDGARLSSVLPRFGEKGGQSVFAIAQRPIQQRVHRQRAAAGIRDVIEAGGDLLGASCQFTAGQCFQYQRRNESVTEQSGFFGFVIHRVFFSRPKA